MKNELGAKWRRGWICSTDQVSASLRIQRTNEKRGNEGVGVGERATHGKTEKKTGDEG